MTAYVIDGKAIAAKVRADVAADVARLKSQHGLVPGLAVVLVGEDPASKVYVRNKAGADRRVRHAVVRAQAGRGHVRGRCVLDARRQAQRRSERQRHPRAAAAAEAHRCEQGAGADRPRQGRRRLPPDERRPPVDRRARRSCPARRSARSSWRSRVQHDLSGLDAVVVGRSNIVGKPMAQLLLRENCTVTIAHSRTQGSPRRRARAPTSSSPPSASRSWSRATGSSRAPSSSTSASTASLSRTARASIVGDVDFAEARRRWRAPSRRCRAASVR